MCAAANLSFELDVVSKHFCIVRRKPSPGPSSGGKNEKDGVSRGHSKMREGKGRKDGGWRTGSDSKIQDTLILYIVLARDKIDKIGNMKYRMLQDILRGRFMLCRLSRQSASQQSTTGRVQHRIRQQLCPYSKYRSYLMSRNLFSGLVDDYRLEEAFFVSFCPCCLLGYRSRV